MGCEDCKANDRFTFDSAMAMAERTIRRLWIVIILLIVLFVGTNIAWIAYENSFEDFYIEQEATADGDGVALNANGEVTYYGSYGETNNQD